MKWLLIILVSLSFITTIIFLILRNIKDEKRFEAELKSIYPEREPEDGNPPINEVIK